MSTDASSAPPPAPLSTYRVQFNSAFTFRDAAGIVPYLDALGVRDLYASPYLRARPGSTHGYDISNHNELNPELGGEAGHAALTEALQVHEMGHLLDIVPNHMGIGESGNHWWMDVLENGPSSAYADYFDIDWHPLKPELTGKILLPVLGDQFGKILESGELHLHFEEGLFRIRYHDRVFPVSPRSSALVLREVLQAIAPQVPGDDPVTTELGSIVSALEHLPSRDRTDQEAAAERWRERLVSSRRLIALHEQSALFREALQGALREYNGRIGDPRSFDKLEEVLEDQAYWLAYWRVAAEEINYRRFFDINELAGVRVEAEETFQATHRLILRLLAQGKITGLRIDHSDGLFDPAGYFARLQEEASRQTGKEGIYILVEKILTGEERLPKWPIAGSVGYDFLNRLNGIFVAQTHELALGRVYERFIGHRIDFVRLAYEKKKLIMRVALASELNVLAHQLNRISEKNRRYRDFTLGSLRIALRETIASFPVYRSYIDAEKGQVGPMDVQHVNRAIGAAIRRNRAMSPSIFDFIRDILLLRWPDDLTESARREHSLFVMKFQQLTGPVMAKGVEDTSFYIFNRLISLNEVGGEPNRFGNPPEELHSWLIERRQEWPDGMNTTSTHDTKRSEDVRARINILSEIPEEWEARVKCWAELNAPKRVELEGERVPDENDEYLLYQTLVGIWPNAEGAEREEEFRLRVKRYMEKATREAKLHTSWINPNEEYDRTLREFIDRILTFDAEENRLFLDDLATFTKELAYDGMFNSLAQLLVKMTAPGVPDFYQGQEIWDFSLVDPDNRRAVDFNLRGELLARLREDLAGGERMRLLEEVLAEWQDGRIKMLVTHLALQARRHDPELFRRGDYLPLMIEGPGAEHLFAFARRAEGRAVLTIVPRLPRTFRQEFGAAAHQGHAWGETCLLARAGEVPGTLRNLFTQETHTLQPVGDQLRLAAAEVMHGFPVALLASE